MLAVWGYVLEFAGCEFCYVREARVEATDQERKHLYGTLEINVDIHKSVSMNCRYLL